MENKDKTLHILSNASGTNKELLNIKLSSGIGDIVLQLDGFNKQNEVNKISRHSHLDIFQNIMRQVTKTPHETIFLNILNYLLDIDPNEALCAAKWQVIEKLVLHTIQMENREDIRGLLKVCQNDSDDARHNVKESILSKSGLTNITPDTTITLTTPPPPPPPILPDGPSPPLSNSTFLRQITKPKLKTCNWVKIPQNQIINKPNIWTIKTKDECIDKINNKDIEELFSLPTINKTNKKSSNNEQTDSICKSEKKELRVLQLLDGQYCLRINIFLSQFKGYNSEDIVQLIRSGNNNKIMDLEKLKDLLKLLPKEDDIKILKNFKGNFQSLGKAEKFLILLLEIPNYKLRIDCTIVKEEFTLTLPYLEHRLREILKAGNDLMDNKSLPKILHIIITIGNYLNSGCFAGNAVGITLASLNKLTDTKTNKSNMHLLHFIAMEVERYDSQLLDFYNQLSFLENVSKVNINQIEEDIKELEITLIDITKQVNKQLNTNEEDIKQQMYEFLLNANSKIKILLNDCEQLNKMRIKMANFFCENEATFKISECFEIFHKFCEQFKQAVKENEKRLRLEKQRNIGQQRKENLTSPVPSKNQTVDNTSKRPNLKILLRSHPNEFNRIKPQEISSYSTKFLKNESNYSQDANNNLESKEQQENSPTTSSKFLERETNITQVLSKNNYETQKSITQLPLSSKTPKNLSKNNTDIQTLPLSTESPVQRGKSKVSLKTMANIARLGVCYTTIREEDLKKAIQNLRPSTDETHNFRRRNTLAFCSCSTTNCYKDQQLKLNINDENINNTQKFQRRNTLAFKPNGIVYTGRRYSSINNEDLKKVIKNLRPQTEERLRRNLLTSETNNLKSENLCVPDDTCEINISSNAINIEHNEISKEHKQILTALEKNETLTKSKYPKSDVTRLQKKLEWTPSLRERLSIQQSNDNTQQTQAESIVTNIAKEELYKNHNASSIEAKIEETKNLSKEHKSKPNRIKRFTNRFKALSPFKLHHK